MARDLMYPIPQPVLDHVECELCGITDRNVRHKIRDLARWVYANGYTDGHIAGMAEMRSDKQAERDAEAAKAKVAGEAPDARPARRDP